MTDMQKLRALLDAICAADDCQDGPLCYSVITVAALSGGKMHLECRSVEGANRMTLGATAHPVADRIAALIAGAVNALPELLDEVERLRAAASAAERRAEEAEAQVDASQSVLREICETCCAALGGGFKTIKISALVRIIRDRLHAAESERDALQTEMARLRSDLDIERAQSAEFMKEIERLREVDAGAAMMRRVLNEVGRYAQWANAARECLRSDAGKAFMGQLISAERELADEVAKVATLREDVSALQRDVSASEKDCRALRAEVERLKARECPKCGGSGGVVVEATP